MSKISWLQNHEENEKEKSCFRYWASNHQEGISFGSSSPGQGSVHVLGGLDNNEMVWLEDKFRLYLSWSLLVAKPMCPVFMWYCWTKKENRVTQTRLVWSCCCEFLKVMTRPLYLKTRAPYNSMPSIPYFTSWNVTVRWGSCGDVRITSTASTKSI